MKSHLYENELKQFTPEFITIFTSPQQFTFIREGGRIIVIQLD